MYEQSRDENIDTVLEKGIQSNTPPQGQVSVKKKKKKKEEKGEREKKKLGHNKSKVVAMT